MRLLSVIALFIALLPLGASAQTAGFLLANEEYQSLSDVRRGDRMWQALPPLQDAGYEMSAGRALGYKDMQAELATFAQRAAEAEALLVVLAGRFMHTPTETYFMPIDAEAGPLVSLPSNTLPLSTVMAILSSKPTKAVLVLATDGSQTAYSPLLKNGIGKLDIPEGVTVLRGSPRKMPRFVGGTLNRAGKPFIGQARREGFSIEGYQTDTMVLLDMPTPAPTSLQDRLDDIRDWRSASDQNSVAAYRDYIAAHPRGEFVAMAENRIKTLTDTPEARAERAEQSLDLNRNARRDIQRDLSILGFNTRGIDGIFGPGTRGAIKAWQNRERLADTGFLSADQIALLDEQAKLRAEQLEAEAAARRAELRAADLDYWDQTGAAGDEAGLRAYLQKYPDGEFAELAEERLAIFEEERRAEVNFMDQQLWDIAVRKDTVLAYEDYLVRRPDGAYREEAQARIVELQRAAQFPNAVQEENAMNLSPRTKQIVEARLKGLGLKPGPVDGVFDDDTRRALRRYQAARKLPESGYMSDAVMVQLMADTVRQIFR